MDSAKCPRCGARLTPDEAERETCPACMLAAGLEIDDLAPPDAPPPGDSGAEHQRIGPYRILRVLGEGGMGVVYLAEQQEPVQRQVALKVVKRGMSSRDVLDRFDAERQALARMDHPSIARVYHAGETPDGMPYFAMEYVDGEPITAWCDRERKTMRERLDLLARVCAGVQHAHHKGVIHRDLKPSNVLVARVDGEALPKIIDFGVAKAIEQRLTERSLFTELGVIVGTPEYMSPEQAELTGERVDTRTDVYALGVLQYELLTGTLPFDPQELRAGGFDQLCRRIREEEPPKPSTRVGRTPARRGIDRATLRRELAGDLDWVTLKALAKDPERRYGSPQELADDIQRFLRHEPVVAGPPSATYRLRKFVRRNRFAVLSAASILLAVVLGLVATSLFAVREATQRRAAEAARRDLETVAAFQASMIADVDPQAAGASLFDDLRRRVAGAAPDLAPEFERALGGINGTDVALKMIESEFLGRAGRVLDAEYGERPLIEARLRRTIANAYRELGLRQAAEPHAVRAVALYRERSGDRDPATLKAVAELGFLLLRMDRLAEAEPLLRETLALEREVLGADDPETLATMNDVALLLWTAGRYEEAEPLFLECHGRRSRVLGPEHADTLKTLGNLGLLYWQDGRLSEAESTLRRTLEGKRRALAPDDPSLMLSVRDLGIVCKQLGRLEEAERLYVEAAEAQRRVLGSDHQDTLTTNLNLASLYHDQGRVEDAEALTRRNIEAQSRVLGPEHGDTCFSVLNLGGMLIERQQLDEAEALLGRAATCLERTGGPGDWGVLAARTNLAAVQGMRGRVAEAERLFRDVLATAGATLGPDHALTLQVQAGLAETYGRAGRVDDAAALFREVADHAAAPAEVKDAAAKFFLDRDPAEAVRYALAASEMTGYTAPRLVETLIAAYRNAGRVADAIAAGRRGLAALPEGDARRRSIEALLRETESPGSG